MCVCYAKGVGLRPAQGGAPPRPTHPLLTWALAQVTLTWAEPTSFCVAKALAQVPCCERAVGKHRSRCVLELPPRDRLVCVEVTLLLVLFLEIGP